MFWSQLCTSALLCFGMFRDGGRKGAGPSGYTTIPNFT